MNLEKIPTPEMDSLEINVPDTRANAIMALNAVIVKGKDLERRLTIAREALRGVHETSSSSRLRRVAKEALTQTTPKP